MQTSGKIILNGHFKNSGFGFSCLQKAVSLSINGSFEYLSGESVQMDVFGIKSSLQDFLQWCLLQTETNTGNLQFDKEIRRYSEFEIINQI